MRAIPFDLVYRCLIRKMRGQDHAITLSFVEPLAPVPFRILPGGYFMGATAARPPHQETIALAELAWDGREVWRFDRAEQVQLADKSQTWAARQHHDWQREGYAAGYYAPGAAPLVESGRTLVLSHKNVRVPAIADEMLEDDYLIEVSWDGQTKGAHEVAIQVLCADKPGLLATISQSFSDQGVNISQAHCRSTDHGRAVNTFHASVKDLDQLKTVIRSLSRIKGVYSVDRVSAEPA